LTFLASPTAAASAETDGISGLIDGKQRGSTVPAGGIGSGPVSRRLRSRRSLKPSGVGAAVASSSMSSSRSSQGSKDSWTRWLTSQLLLSVLA
jgi:hypothetical protein